MPIRATDIGKKCDWGCDRKVALPGARRCWPHRIYHADYCFATHPRRVHSLVHCGSCGDVGHNINRCGRVVTLAQAMANLQKTLFVPFVPSRSVAIPAYAPPRYQKVLQITQAAARRRSPVARQGVARRAA